MRYTAERNLDPDQQAKVKGLMESSSAKVLPFLPLLSILLFFLFGLLLPIYLLLFFLILIEFLIFILEYSIRRSDAIVSTVRFTLRLCRNEFTFLCLLAS